MIHLFKSAVILGFIFSLIACDNAKKTTEYKWPIPKGYPKPQVPTNNPMSEAKVKLGRFLFYDKNLSANQTQSCATCHQQDKAFSESLAVSIGSTGQSHRRNSLALVNIAYNKTLTWAHPSLDSIERQILLPLFGEEPIEMGVTGYESEILSRFNTEDYKAMFSAAFDDDDINFDKINKALASFVRRLVSFNSPFDRYAYAMQDDALSESQIRGMDLFFSERLECHHCHGGFNFTQSTTHEKQLLDRRPFHNTGLYNLDGKGSYPLADIGLSEITLDPNDMGVFRAPTLRNIALTAPYMHDGSISTLEEVVEHYNAGGRADKQFNNQTQVLKNIYKSPFVKKLVLTSKEKSDLIAFLNALTDESFVSDPQLSNPFN
ncbi:MULTISPECIES: methanobactin export MATE transporter MbnM [unclassified Pseudoalteromonas]|uniref:methanobactin export MATE transporter MbnM n=1 Tax=unclassified Pseudoalteromonas TaxID=194690 RepID=UPI0005A7D2BD|nr:MULTISPECIES: methanobactin export MATE transporter MbnM [unclassified Pseudoalteromonas]